MAAPGPKSQAFFPLDLTGCPDPLTDLAAARLWVMENYLNMNPYKWQREIIEDIGGYDRGGQDVAYIQVARKNGKSALAAAMVLTEIILLPDRQVYGVADTEKNLDSVLMEELRGFFARSPQLSAALKLYADKIENPDNGSFFKVRPGTFAASQGINPHMVVFDELHLQKTDAIWNGMMQSGAARDYPLLFGITTPGLMMAGPAYNLYLQAKTGEADMYVRIYEPSNAEHAHDDSSRWHEGNPILFDKPDFLKNLERNCTRQSESSFRAFHMGQWANSAKVWIDPEVWSSRTAQRDFEPGERVWLGFDGSYSQDSTALIAVSEKLHVKVLGLWEKLNDPDYRVPRSEVHDAVRQAFRDLNVVMMACDPPYWQTDIEGWAQEFGERRVIAFPSGSSERMAPACTMTYAAVFEGKLTHDGDPRLSAHFTNAAVKNTYHGDTITKQTKYSPAKIDGAVATCIAVSMAAMSKPPRPKIALGVVHTRH